MTTEHAGIDESMLVELVARGRAAWPGVELPEEVVIGHLRDVLGGLVHIPEGLHVEDLYLACGCAIGDERALAAFEDRLLSQVKVFLGRMKPAPGVVDEVKQVLRVRLLVAPPGEAPRIAEYGGRGSLVSWVRVAAIRAAIDIVRAAGSTAYEAPADDGEPMFDRIGSGDPELEVIKERYRGALSESVREAFGTLTPEQRNLLRLNYRDGRSIDEIGALMKAHRATVARWIAAAREHILDETRRRLEQRLRLRPHEFESLLGVLSSRMQVSVIRLLDEG